MTSVCKVAVFDFDGTLADTYPWFQTVLHDVATQYGFRAPDPSEHAALRLQDARGVLRALGIPLWKAPRILSHMRARMQASEAPIALFPGIQEVLERLAAQGVRLVLLSSNSEENVRRILGDALAERFERTMCGTDLFGKANKLTRVLRAMDCAPDQAMLIGDEIRDIDAARACGVRMGAVAWGYNHADALRARAPDVLFEQPADILHTLLS